MKKMSLFGMIALVSVSLFFLGCPAGDSEPEQVTVSFDTDGGSAAPSAVTVEKEGTITLPTSPAKSGYDFDGWYTTKSGGGTAFTATTKVTASITVYAKWTEHFNNVIASYALSTDNNANPAGLSISSAKQSALNGITTIYLTGTVADEINNWSETNVWGAGETDKPDTGAWSWAVIDGILTDDALEAGTVIKQTNESFRYYKGGHQEADNPLTNPVSTGTEDIYIPDTGAVYKWKLYTNANGARDTTGGGFGVLLWSEAAVKTATIEITPDDAAAYTIIVDWSGLTIE
jgi:uncharacterized repeat protein (TIGR02543 family)